ncbi:hypothetical protein Tco_1182051 [Tanacetum coccineum]
MRVPPPTRKNRSSVTTAMYWTICTEIMPKRPTDSIISRIEAAEASQENGAVLDEETTRSGCEQEPKTLIPPQTGQKGPTPAQYEGEELLRLLIAW